MTETGLQKRRRKTQKNHEKTGVSVDFMLARIQVPIFGKLSNFFPNILKNYHSKMTFFQGLEKTIFKVPGVHPEGSP